MQKRKYFFTFTSIKSHKIIVCPTKLGHRVWTDACDTIVVPLTDSSESGVRNRTILYDFDAEVCPLHFTVQLVSKVTRVIYSACRSLIKLVSDATKQISLFIFIFFSFAVIKSCLRFNDRAVWLINIMPRTLNRLHIRAATNSLALVPLSLCLCIEKPYILLFDLSPLFISDSKISGSQIVL